VSEPYDAMPAQPPWDGEDSAHPAAGGAPASVVRAAWSLYGLAALQIFGMATALLAPDSAREAIRQTDPELTEAEVSTLFTIGLVFTIVVAAVFAGVYLLCARKVLAGRSWARVVASVLTGLVIVLDVLSLARGALTDSGDAFTPAITVVGLVLAAAVLAMAWSPTSNTYFTAPHARS
jgi:hypothetical protein